MVDDTAIASDGGQGRGELRTAGARASGHVLIARLEKFFFLLLALCPFAMGALYALVNMTGGWARFINGHDYAFYYLQNLASAHFLLGFLVCVALLGLLWWICRNTWIEESSCRRGVQCALLVFLLAFSLRLCFYLAFGRGIANTFDPGEAWLRAGGTLHGEDVRVTTWGRYCPWWLYYALVMKAFICLFGDRFDLFMALQTVFGGLTAVATFMLGRVVSGSIRVAMAAALLYALNPSAVVYYTACANPEHIAVAFHVTAIWMAVVLIRDVGSMRLASVLLFASVMGACIAIGDVFKPVFPVFIIAFALVTVLLLARLKCVGRRRIAGRLMVAIFICIVVRYFFLCTFMVLSESCFDIRTTASEAMPHHIFVGLERGGEGQVGRSRIGTKYFKMLDAGISSRDAVKQVRRELFADWAGHLSEFPAHVIKKSIWAWQDDCCAFYYFMYNRMRGGIAPEREKVVRKLCEYGASITLVIYFMVMLLAFLFTICFAIGRVRVGVGHMFCGIFVFGFFLLMIVIESTMRYKVVVMPYIFIYAACALQVVFSAKVFRRGISIMKGGWK